MRRVADVGKAKPQNLDELLRLEGAEEPAHRQAKGAFCRTSTSA
jgi:hypothetical protein